MAEKERRKHINNIEKTFNTLSKMANLADMYTNGMSAEIFEKMERETIMEHFDMNPNKNLNFDNVSSFHNGFAYVSVKDKWGIINQQGRLCIKPMYRELKAFDEDLPFADMTFYAKFDKNIVKVLNSKGFEISTVDFNEIFLDSTILYPAQKGGEYCAIDRFGNIKIPFGKYPCIFNFYKTDNNEVFGIISDGINVGLIDKIGNEIISFECGYENIMWVDNFTLITNKNGKWGVIDMNNNIIIPFEYDYIDYMREGYRYVKQGNKYGFIDGNGKMLEINT